jgi:hypothetical protein
MFMTGTDDLTNANSIVPRVILLTGWLHSAFAFDTSKTTRKCADNTPNRCHTYFENAQGRFVYRKKHP